MPPLPRRILITTDTVGGVWTFSVELARVLSSQGSTIWLAALGGTPSVQQEREAALPNVRVFASNYKLEWMPDPWEDLEASGRWLMDLQQKLQPDVVHLNSFGHATLDWKCPTVLTAHSCVASWWRSTKGVEIPAEWSRYRALVYDALRAADVATAPSHTMAAALAREYDASFVTVIPNGRLRPTLPDLDKEPFVFAAGRLWDEAKNIAALTKVAPYVTWPVYVAGESEQDISGCRDLGKLKPDELWFWFARASIYALPARYEPFGLSVLEAALSGCALVLGDIPSLRENWNGAAVFVPPNDHTALRRAISDLASNPEWRASMAARARDRAAGFTVERMATAYGDLYEHLVEQRFACAS